MDSNCSGHRRKCGAADALDSDENGGDIETRQQDKDENEREMSHGIRADRPRDQSLEGSVAAPTGSGVGSDAIGAWGDGVSGALA